MSARYMANGSSTFSPSLNAAVGRPGHNGVQFWKAFSKSRVSKRTNSLRFQIIGVIVSCAQRVRSQHDAAFNFRAKALIAAAPEHFRKLRASFARYPKRTPSKRARFVDASAVATM